MPGKWKDMNMCGYKEAKCLGIDESNTFAGEICLFEADRIEGFS